LVFGLVGTGVELLLLSHYEDPWQLVPLGLIAAGLAALAWDAARSSATTKRIVRITMVLFALSGGLGTVLHYRGNLEFQLEIDASQSRWDLFRKVMRAKAPPALAPGLMIQLGLLGLIYTIGASHESQK
jgi:hypothetical protein